MNHQQLIPHLFRTEFGKITAVLTRLFGIEHIEIAEDIASDSFLLAVETWPYKGIPENPTAWLYVVAKNKAKNFLHRNDILQKKIVPQIDLEKASEEPNIDLSDQNITDSQLKMLFAVCHPTIPVESQVGLALRILCGFGIEEIADAFLTNKENINKRLYRAREQLRKKRSALNSRKQMKLISGSMQCLRLCICFLAKGIILKAAMKCYGKIYAQRQCGLHCS
jgi:RNA polymerase sigma-70 factor (ECF subfamily)